MTVTGPDTREFYELTPEEQEQRKEECLQIQKQIKASLKAGRKALWELARHLYEFKIRSGWTALGYGKQSEWLAQPDINVTYQDFFKLTRMYRVLHLESGRTMEELADYEHSKLAIALPAIEQHRAPIEQILDNVKAWTASDLREEYKGSGVRGLRGGPAAENGHRPYAEEDDTAAVDGDVTSHSGEVIEGTATDVGDDAPVQSPASEPEPEPEPEVDSKLVHAQTVVDSWFSVGGDRRKAIRNWNVFVERHPVLESVRQIQKLIDGDEDAPERDDAREMWNYLRVALDLQLEDGAG